MIMEDLEAPHHMTFLRYFMAQGLVHGQSLLYATPLSPPQAFLGTLPALNKDTKDSYRRQDSLDKTSEGEGLRIAWQYRRVLNEQQALDSRRQRQKDMISQLHPVSNMQNCVPGLNHEYCDSFDLRRPMERLILNRANVECINLQIETLCFLREKCEYFFSSISRLEDGLQQIGRVAIQSLCAPQSLHLKESWDTLNFIQFLKGMLRVSNAVAMITFPASLLSHSFSVRLQHMADILLSVEAIPDESKEMSIMVMDYQDIVGFLRILKLPCLNTQVPTIPDAVMYAIKLMRRRTVLLERLNQAPVDVTGGGISGTAAGVLCSGSVSGHSPLDF
eukprot:c27094_g1_i1 orf=485-1483(-)